MADRVRPFFWLRPSIYYRSPTFQKFFDGGAVEASGLGLVCTFLDAEIISLFYPEAIELELSSSDRIFAKGTFLQRWVIDSIYLSVDLSNSLFSSLLPVCMLALPLHLLASNIQKLPLAKLWHSASGFKCCPRCTYVSSQALIQRIESRPDFQTARQKDGLHLSP
jgi:hypothetical protein